MRILTIRTDNPQAEVGLYDDAHQQDYHRWQAHRQLAETIHDTIRRVLDDNHMNLSDIQGVAVYRGPGSFTGLRIGLSVANAFAASYNIPIVGATGEDWQAQAVERLLGSNAPTRPVVPEYGAPVHITSQKK